MRLLGLTLAAGIVLAAAGESKAQLMIGNPYTGSGVFIGGGGVSIGNGYGYNGFGMPGYGGLGLAGTRYYSSGYAAPGLAGPYGLGSFPAYSATTYSYPSYGYRSYGYTYPRAYRRGLFGRRYYRW